MPDQLDVKALLVDCKNLENPWIHAEPKALAVIRVAKALRQALSKIAELELRLGVHERDEYTTQLLSAIKTRDLENAALQQELAALRADKERLTNERAELLAIIDRIRQVEVLQACDPTDACSYDHTCQSHRILRQAIDQARATAAQEPAK